MRVNVARWGNSLGVRVPKEIAARVGLREGSRVEIAADNDGRIVLTMAKPMFTLEDLLVGMTPEAMHEALGPEGGWGPDLGREQVD